MALSEIVPEICPQIKPLKFAPENLKSLLAPMDSPATLSTVWGRLAWGGFNHSGAVSGDPTYFLSVFN